jgi:aspartyl aminopeptidase
MRPEGRDRTGDEIPFIGVIHRPVEVGSLSFNGAGSPFLGNTLGEAFSGRDDLCRIMNRSTGIMDNALALHHNIPKNMRVNIRRS